MSGAGATIDRGIMKTDRQRRANLRTALIMVAIAAAFFAGIVVKYWLFG